MKKLVAIIMVCVMALALCSCGSKFVGEWKGSLMGVELEVTLKRGGKGTLSANGGTKDITWKADGDTVTLSSEGEEEGLELVLEDDELILGSGDVKVPLKKQK